MNESKFEIQRRAWLCSAVLALVLISVGSALADNAALVVLHADPGDEIPGNVDGGPGATNWNRLQAIVAKADEGGHKLTVLLAPQWLDFLDDAMCTGPGQCFCPAGSTCQTLKTWILGGHSLGFHHHDCSHAVPDRYCDDSETDAVYTCDGCSVTATVATGLAEGATLQVALSETFDIANFGTNGRNQRQYEWQNVLAHSTASISPQSPFSGDLEDGHDSSSVPHTFISQPRCRSYDDDGGDPGDFSVKEVGHHQLSVGDFGPAPGNGFGGELRDLDEALVAVFDAADPHRGANGDDVYLGVVFHPEEYDSASGSQDFTVLSAAASAGGCGGVSLTDEQYIDQIFCLLDAHGVTSVTAESILDADDPCDPPLFDDDFESGDTNAWSP